MSRLRCALVFVGFGLANASVAPATEAAARTQPAPSPPKSINLLPSSRYYGELAPSVDYSEFQRDIQACFQPTRTMITEDSKPHALLRQVTSVPTPVGGPPGRVLPPNKLVEAQELADAVREAYEHPTSERIAEVTVVTGPDGEIISFEVSVSSGQQDFDAAGVEAIRSALTRRRSNAKLREVRMLWRFRASYAVTMPRVLFPLGGGMPIPQPVWWEFNEASGKIATKTAFADKIATEVTLMSVSAASQ